MNEPNVPVKRLQLDPNSGIFVEAPIRSLFLRGPIPLDWLDRAAHLPGKALNVALAICWLIGMSKSRPVRLTRKALAHLNVSRDAATDGIRRLEDAGLILVVRNPGRCHVVSALYEQADPPALNAVASRHVSTSASGTTKSC